MMRFGKILTILFITGSAILDAGAKSAETKLPSLFEFGAQRCNACRKMMPVIENLKKEYAGVMKVVFVDVWLKENTAKAVKHKISSIPTQIFFDAQGKELWRHEGYISMEDILAKWKELGYDFGALKKAGTAKAKK